ncbi:MAG: hypothetical protein HY453_02090 [Parcubacteria group bacterium]|nr:hypothetical protein [Parcubacteria group bacterium]
MKRILFIGSAKAHEKKLASIRDFEIHYLPIWYNPRNNYSDFDILNYLDSARALIKAKKIEGIMYTHDLSSVMAALLCAEFGLPGPSLASTFACFNKIYTRQFCPYEKIQCSIIDPYNPEIQEYPFYLKAPYSSLGLLGFFVKNPDDFEKALQIVKVELPKMNHAFFPMLEMYVDMKKFPSALRDVMLAETPISLPQITIEGYVYRGIVHTLVITDTNFIKNTNWFDNFSMPSRIPDHIQNLIHQKAVEDIAKIGLDNSFFNIEYWYDTHDVILIEINSRSAACFSDLYEKCYGFDSYLGMMKLAAGTDPCITPKPRKFGGQFNVITDKDGMMHDLMDLATFEKLPCNKYLCRNVTKPVRSLSAHGNVLAQMEIFGDSYEAILNEAEKYRNKLLKS